MASYTYTNTTNQGLNVTWISGSAVQYTLLGSGQTTTFTADSLTPETTSLIEAGFLVAGGVGASVAIPATSAVPIVLIGTYQSTVQYRKGQVVKYGATYYIGLRTSTGATPSSSTSDWEVFGGPGSGTIGAHVSDTSNPHSVTAAQVGAIATSTKGAANGVASLDGDVKVPLAQIPDLTTQTQVAALLASQHTRNADSYLDFGGANQVAASALKTHLASSSNPHGVTAAQVGAIATSTKGAANGVASLDSSGYVPAAQLVRGIASVTLVADIAARDALSPKQSDFVKVTDADGSGTTKSYVYTGSAWLEVVAAAPVQSVNGLTGVITLTTSNVAEGTNLYYTESRVNSNANVAANTAARHSQNTDTYLDLGNPNEVTAGSIRSHLDSVSNPHGVTAAQVGAITAVVDDTSPTLGGNLNAGGFYITGLADTAGATNAATQGFVATYYLPKLATYTTKGGSYTIASSDSGKIVRFTATATATLPNGMSNGFQVVIANSGTGTVTVAAAGTLNSKGNQIRTQYSSAVATHIGSNVWEVYGDLV